jgi:(R,R)-butanediol dehydrogenase / meso-butanediol dehydrogenase / diacetyl reductase
MKAAVFRGIQSIELEDVPVPEAGPDDVVMAVRACGICGSDLHTYLQGTLVVPGQVMGHEFAGEIVEKGSAVRDLEVGDRITAVPSTPCGRCARCRDGRCHLCAQAWVGAIGYGRPGAFAERVTIPRATLGQNVFRLGPGMSFEEGALVEPLAVAVHGVNLAGTAVSPALVLGLGTIGQQVVQALRVAGVRRVIGVDVSELRLRTAALLGAEVVAGGDRLATVLGPVLSPDQQIDAVFECSGVPALLKAALGVIRPGGTVVSLALYDDALTVNPSVLTRREVRLQGSLAYTPGDFRAALELLRTGAAYAEPLITHREPLQDIKRAFATQLRKDESIKVMVVP